MPSIAITLYEYQTNLQIFDKNYSRMRWAHCRPYRPIPYITAIRFRSLLHVVWCSFSLLCQTKTKDFKLTTRLNRPCRCWKSSDSILRLMKRWSIRFTGFSTRDTEREKEWMTGRTKAKLCIKLLNCGLAFYMQLSSFNYSNKCVIYMHAARTWIISPNIGFLLCRNSNT